ncbi:Cytochrome P450 71D11 [Morus notabilis]|uniref:Cytochrome P450 71D11 n=1 Tax=Morus notabilis TaxID=981085 RepID=W9QEF2_9ROSA|nr:Cytochrome P450 71D11 [Morus notabilis]
MWRPPSRHFMQPRWCTAAILSPARLEGCDQSSIVSAVADATAGHEEVFFSFPYTAALAAAVPHPAAASLSVPPNGRTLVSSTPDIISVGSETSSTTLEWAISEMLKNPKVMEKAQAEVKTGFSRARKVYYKGTYFEYISFGVGRRICPAVTFGVAVVELILVQLLYHFDRKLPANEKMEDLDMTQVFGVTVGRKMDLCLVHISYNS